MRWFFWVVLASSGAKHSPLHSRSHPRRFATNYGLRRHFRHVSEVPVLFCSPWPGISSQTHQLEPLQRFWCHPGAPGGSRLLRRALIKRMLAKLAEACRGSPTSLRWFFWVVLASSGAKHSPPHSRSHPQRSATNCGLRRHFRYILEVPVLLCSPWPGISSQTH